MVVEAVQRNVEEKIWGGEIRRNFWSVRMIKCWNALPDSIKKQETVNAERSGQFLWMGGPEKRKSFIKNMKSETQEET